MFDECIPITTRNDMVDFMENLDYSVIEEGAAHQFAPDTKWRCIACLGVDVYVFHLTDVPMGGVSDFFDLECGEEGADYGNDDDDDDDGSYNSSGSYKKYKCVNFPTT